MPELPEVETIVRQLKNKVVGQTIERVDILRPDQWKQNDPEDVAALLRNKKVSDINRRAKFIIIDFEDDGQLLIHLRMTGKLIWSEEEPATDKYTRTVFYFQSGRSLQFNDTRALGTLSFLPPDKRDLWQSKIGIEPLSSGWTIHALKKMISKSKLDIKSFLLDQSKIAGIGNIYASEILFRAGIHPERRANGLADEEIKCIYKQVPAVLQLAIDKMGTSLGDGKQNFRSVYNIEGEFQNILRVYGREGEPCYACGSPIVRIKQKGRSSYFCGGCQR